MPPTNKPHSDLVVALSKAERSSPGYRLILGIVLIATVTLAFRYYLLLFNWRPDFRCGLIELIDGTAFKPFVTRMLVPFLIKQMTILLPITPEAAASAVMYLSLIAFVFAFRYLLAAFWKPSIISDALTWLSILGLLPFMVSFSRAVYDFPTLFLFTLELGFLAHRRWKWFLIVFPVACLNRETSILLCLAFAVHYYPRMERRFFLKMLSGQGVSYILTRAYILLRFWDNPGGAFEWHLPDQIRVLSQIPSVFETFAPLGLIALLFLVCGIAILFLMLFLWEEKPRLLRDAALVMVPPLALTHLLFGMPFEIRVFYEVYPVVLLLCVEPIFTRLSLELQAASGVVAPQPA
jgi:hypothetical protein